MLLKVYCVIFAKCPLKSSNLLRQEKAADENICSDWTTEKIETLLRLIQEIHINVIHRVFPRNFLSFKVWLVLLILSVSTTVSRIME